MSTIYGCLLFLEIAYNFQRFTINLHGKSCSSNTYSDIVQDAWFSACFSAIRQNSLTFVQSKVEQGKVS